MNAATAASTTTQPAQKTSLAISYSGLLYGLADATTTLAVLDSSIFYFGCTRSHAFDPESIVRHLGHREDFTHEMLYQLHEELRRIFAEAEADGRMAWRAEAAESSWQGLNELLQANSLPPIDPTSHHYSYPGVKEAIEAQQLPYTVAHRC